MILGDEQRCIVAYLDGLDLTPVPYRDDIRVASSGSGQSIVSCERRKNMSNKQKDEAARLEEQYPGITEQLNQFKEAKLPSCPHCKSVETASVQVGIVGRTMTLAALTKKIKLVPNMGNDKGKFFCNTCKKYFD